MSKPKFLPLIGSFFFIIILLIVIASKLGSSSAAVEEPDSPVASGVAYLQSLEAQDPAEVENTLKFYRQQEMASKREERLQQLQSGAISVWSLFEDYVLLGDSRAMGFDYYHFLEDDRVLAEKGDTILTLQEHIPEIEAMNPSYVFISYGVNDVGSQIWASPEDYTADFTSIIQDIHTSLPDVKIYVNSILLAYDPAFLTSSAWYDIPEYNTALEQMCAALPNCYYIDNTALCEESYSLYEGDGIHVKSTFYPYWATNMIMEVYDSELVEGEDSGL